MAELEVIAEILRRQKEDLDELRQKITSRSVETTELVDQIEDLRRRAEETQRRFHDSARRPDSRKTK